MSETILLGNQAEEKAVKFLKKNKYVVIEQNARSRYGEIDIVAEDKESTVFVEVRYRSNSRYGSAQETVTKKKQKKIIAAAVRYCKINRISDKFLRFDIVAFNGNMEDPILIKNAFQPSQGTPFSL